MTATVTLENKGYAKSQADFEVKLINKNSFDYLHAIDVDSSGIAYVIDDRALLKFTPEGETEVMATDLPVNLVDIIADVEASGYLYFLSSEYSYYRFDSVENVLTEYATGRNSQKAFALAADGKLVIAFRQGVFEIDAAGNITDIVGLGLANASAMVMSSDGVIYISDEGGNAIRKYSEGALSTFIAEISSPSAMVIDSRDYLYVTSFSQNSLFEIRPGGEIRTITTELKGPKDLKLKDDGSFIVANYNSNEIVQVSASGSISVLIEPTLNRPMASSVDSNGNLVIANYDGTVIRLDRDFNGDSSIKATGLNLPKDIVMLPDNSATVLHEGGRTLTSVSPSGLIQSIPASGLTGATAVIQDESGDGYLLASNKNGISRLSSSGVISAYLPEYFSNPRLIRHDDEGKIYILTDSDSIVKIDPMTEQIQWVVEDFGFDIRSESGMSIASDGTIYISDLYGKKIVKLSENGSLETLVNLDFNPGPIDIGPEGSLLIAKRASKEIYQFKDEVVSLFVLLESGSVYRDLRYDANLDSLWVADRNYKIIHVDSEGTQTSIDPPGGATTGLTLLTDGSILVGQSYRLTRITATHNVTDLIEPSLLTGQVFLGVVVDSEGKYWAVDSNGKLTKFGEDGSVDKRFASINSPSDMVWGEDGELYLLDGGSLFRLGDTNQLHELLLVGSNYIRLDSDTETTLLLGHWGGVDRFDLGSGQMTSVISGQYRVETITRYSDGNIAVLDGTKNHLSEYSSQGELIRKMIGIVNPTAVEMDENGDLYVANTTPLLLLKQDSSGYLEEFGTYSRIDNLNRLSNNNLNITNNNYLIEIQPDGSLVSNTVMRGVIQSIPLSNGDRMILNRSGLFLDSANEQNLVVSGFSSISDIALDNNSNIYVADYNFDMIARVNLDQSIELFASDLPRAKSLAFDHSSGVISVIYSLASKVAYLDEDANRINTSNNLIPRDSIIISAVTAESSYMASRKDIVRLTRLNNSSGGLNPGDVVYSHSSVLPALDVDDPFISIDFGTWRPVESGDYRLTLTADDNAIESELINTLHVGPLAQGEFNLNQNETLMGAHIIGSDLEVFGADSSSVTRLEAEGIVLTAESGAQGRAIGADSVGNIYAADSYKIVKIAPNGEISDFSTDLPKIGAGLAVDYDNFIYAVSRFDILRIDQEGNYSVLARLDGTATAVAISYANEIYAVTSSNTLFQIHRDGSTEVVSTAALSSPQGLSIDPQGNIYVLNAGHQIVRITPEGVASIYYEDARFEYEGVNVTADCSGNLIFAPTKLEPFKPNTSEEDILVQLMRDTGEVRLVLEGPTIDQSLDDIDVVYYDRFANRVLIWTDFNNGKIFSFPVICGGIDTEVHLQTRGDVELASVEPAADSVIDLGDNQFEYIWSLKDVDIDGVKLNLNWLFTDLTEGEQRPVVENAYLQFNNSFDADNPVQVPIDIPTLTVNSQMTVTPTVEPIGYGPNADVLITIDVSNEHSAPFSGTVQLRIVDENQVEVAVLDPLIISDLSAHTSTAIQTLWNTAATYAGDYSVEAELMDSNGVSIAEGASNLTVSSSMGSVIAESHIASDKTLYYSSDLVTLDGWLNNPSSNSVVDASRTTLTVLDPQGLVIFDYVNSFGELYPLSQQNIHVSFMLNGAPIGGYQLILEIHDEQTNTLISTDSYSFSVEQIGVSASGIIGLASASSTAVTRGHELSCDYLIKNIGATEYSDLALRQLLLDVDADAQLSELNFDLPLTSQSEQQISHDINTAALSLGGYACVLQAQLDGEWQTLDGVGFLVQDDPVLLEIEGSVAVSNTEISKAQPVTCTDSVENQNDETVTLTLHRRLHKSSFVVIDETQAAITLAPGEIYTGSRAYDTSSWALGTYQCSLLATIGVSEKQIDSVGFELINVAPIANAGINQTVDTDTVVELDGTASADPNGDSVSFQWFLISQPDDSVSELQNATTSAPSLLIDKKGDYTVQLVVSDGEFDSTVLVIIEGLNNLPIANAGADQGVLIGDTAILDGSASTDIDGDALVYQWQIIELPPESDSTLSDANEVMPTLTIDNHGQYIIHLTVNDGEADSAIDTVTLTVGNVAPTANAGADQSGFIGETVSINGAGSSDADGDTLTYQWSLAGKPNGSSATLADPTAVISHLTLDEHGVYSIELVVSDGIESSDADITTINTLNTKPVADSGDDRAVFVGDDVELDAQASFDADGDPVVYQWSLLSKPDTSSAALSSVDQVSPQLTIDEAGVYIVQLIVNDGIENSDPDTVLLTTQNVRPVAEAGTEQLAETGETVMLDGSNSSDPDNDLISYSWSLISQPQGSSSQIMDATAVTANFNADLAGLYVAQLIVSDDEFASEPDTVVITVESSVPPVDCDEATVYPLSLWPPNHKFKEVQIEGLGSDITIHVSQITQDEPMGNSSPDAIIELDSSGGSDRIYLRSEREGNLLNGRVYQIHFEAENPQAGGCTGSVTVAVPHDQNKAPVDDGQTVDSLVSD